MLKIDMAFSVCRASKTSGHVPDVLAGSGGITCPRSAIALVLTDTAVERVVAALTEQSVIAGLTEQQVCCPVRRTQCRAAAGADDIVPFEAVRRCRRR